jgi:hypothetical protein
MKSIVAFPEHDNRAALLLRRQDLDTGSSDNEAIASHSKKIPLDITLKFRVQTSAFVDTWLLR